jgi:hypothetical protein
MLRRLHLRRITSPKSKDIDYTAEESSNVARFGDFDLGLLVPNTKM